MNKLIGIVLIVPLLTFGLSGCGQSGQDTSPSKIPEQNGKATQLATPPATAESSKIELNEGDVRKLFIAQPQPLLDQANQVSVLASSQKKLKPRVLVKEVDYPKSLVFARDGTLYFIGDHEDAIVALAPDGKSKVIARSGVMGYVTPDDKTEPEPVYNTFEGLSIDHEGNLLTLLNAANPYEINTSTGEKTFQRFVLPSGEVVNSPENITFPKFKDYLNWQFGAILADKDSRIVIFNKATGIWYTYKKGMRLEKLTDLSKVSTMVYLKIEGFDFGILGADGYIYGVTEGGKPNAPDRVVRIGDPGQSSLRANATSATIAEFKHGELTGALAFSPKGELAVGAKNAIYLITPIGKK